MVAPTVAGKERRRCVNIVKTYRDELTKAYCLKPDAANAPQVLKVIQRLDAMIHEMNCLPRENAPKSQKDDIYAGDFSMEEIAKAEEIIRDQERNPFD